MKAIVLGLVTTVSLIVLALPRDVAAADCFERIRLFPTAEGESVDAIGQAQIQSNDAGEQQFFTVEVSLAVPDGTSLYVFANGEPAGTITVTPDGATLDLSNANGVRLPPGMDPVCAIGPISVTDAGGTTLLTGDF